MVVLHLFLLATTSYAKRYQSKFNKDYWGVETYSLNSLYKLITWKVRKVISSRISYLADDKLQDTSLFQFNQSHMCHTWHSPIKWQWCFRYTFSFTLQLNNYEDITTATRICIYKISFWGQGQEVMTDEDGRWRGINGVMMIELKKQFVCSYYCNKNMCEQW